MEKMLQNYIFYTEFLKVELEKEFYLLEKLAEGNYEEILDPSERTPLHPEYGVDTSIAVEPENIPY